MDRSARSDMPGYEGKAPSAEAARETAGAARPTPARRLPVGLIVVAAFAAVVIAVVVSGLHRYLSFSTLLEYQDALDDLVEHHRILAAFLFVFFYVAVVAFSIPGGVVLTVTGGFLFGGLFGSFLTIISATLGVASLYAIAATSVGPVLRRHLGKQLTRIDDGFRDGAWSYLLFLRLVPIFPFWVVNLAAACLQVPLVPLLVTTFVGMLPATLAFSFAGASFGELVAAQADALAACRAGGKQDCGLEFEASHVLTPQLFVALVGLGIVALIPVAMKAWRRKTRGV